MKKIMFNDRFGLTDAVLEGRKIVTRRIVPDEIIQCVCSTIIDGQLLFECWNKYDAHVFIKPTYQVGEIVDISQSMRNVCNGSDLGIQIEMLDIRVERLQDITDEDCIKEGISSYDLSGKNYTQTIYGIDKGIAFIELGKTPREAFASLIDKVSGKGTWESNPYVFRYEFKLLTGTDLKVEV